MANEVILDVTTIEENVTVETTAGDVVEVNVVATQGAAATVTVGSTTTGSAGTNASVTNSGTTSAAVFNFTIPRGDKGDDGADGQDGAAGPNSVTSATTSDGTAELSVDTITGDGSGLTGLVSAQITDASTTPVYNETTEIYEEVAVLYNEDGELNALDFIANGSFRCYISDTQTASFTSSPSPINVIYGENVWRINNPTTNGTRQWNLPTSTSGTFAITSNSSGLISSSDISDVTTTGEANKLAKVNAGGNLVCNIIIAKDTLEVGEEDGDSGLITITNTSGKVGRFNNANDANGVVLSFPATTSGNYTTVCTNNIDGRADKLHDGNVTGTTQVNATSLTLNTTNYTYGTGAAVAHSSALGVVDSRVASLFTSPFHFQQDNYLGRWLTASGNNAFNWIGVGSASNWSDAPFYATGFIGGVNLMTNNNAFFYYMTATAAASISNFNGVVFDHVFSTVNTSIANENIFVGIRNIGSATVETGRRGLWYEAGVDTNWQLLHETSAGVQTKIDTGKPVALNQTVRVTLKFVSATQTDMIIATSTSTTPATSSATTGFSCTGGVGLGFGLRSTTAANRFILPMRSILAWTPSTL
jgi:hypothetical protein